MIGKHLFIIPQGICVDKAFEVFSRFEVIRGFLVAQQAVVCSVSDERQSEEILHPQLGNTPAFLNKLVALESSKIRFQCRGFTQQSLQHTEPKHRSYHSRDLEYELLLSREAINACQ